MYFYPTQANQFLKLLNEYYYNIMAEMLSTNGYSARMVDMCTCKPSVETETGGLGSGASLGYIVGFKPA